MEITYKSAFDAFSALKGIMSTKGLCGSSQIKLVRLWKELRIHAETMTEADSALVSEYGTVEESGLVKFYDDGKRSEFLKKRAEMFSEKIDISPITIKSEDALWDAMSPEVLSLLDGIILIEEEEK